MFLFCSYLKSTVSTLKELIFTFSRELIFGRKSSKLLFFLFLIFPRINFCQKPYFTCFARITFNELSKKDILPAAITCFMRLKKTFTRLARDLICTIQIFKIFTGIKFYQFRDWQFTNAFSRS